MMKNDKDWTGNKKSVFVTLGASNHSSELRHEHDYYATAPVAIDGLNKVLPLKGMHIWEPACGAGHLSERMSAFGARVISSDLYDRQYGIPGVNFLECQELAAPVIVTNPPYKYALEFVEHSINLGAEKVAMFLKITFLESQGRSKLFRKYPPRVVAVFTKRVQVAINGDAEMFAKSSAACYAWFIWERGYTGQPNIEWI